MISSKESALLYRRSFPRGLAFGSMSFALFVTVLLFAIVSELLPFAEAITAGTTRVVPGSSQKKDGIADERRNFGNDRNESECADKPTDGKQRGKLLEEPFDEHDLLRAYEEIKAEYYEKAFGGVFGFNDDHDDEKALSEGKNSWKLLTTMNPNKKKKKHADDDNDDEIIKVSMLEHPSDPLCPYVKMETVMPLSLEKCWDFLALDKWDETMPKMDPFYEGLDIYGEYAVPTSNDGTAIAGSEDESDGSDNPAVKMVLARKRTKRILAFGKREFVFVSVEDVPLKDGTWVSGTVSVEVPEGDATEETVETEDSTADSDLSKLPSLRRNKSYTRAFQDSIAFYKPLPPKEGRENGRTRVTIVCRIDLNDSSGKHGSGGCIPMWLYVKTIGITGARSVLSMRNVLLEEEQAAATNS